MLEKLSCNQNFMFALRSINIHLRLWKTKLGKQRNNKIDVTHTKNKMLGTFVISVYLPLYLCLFKGDHHEDVCVNTKQTNRCLQKKCREQWTALIAHSVLKKCKNSC